VPRSTSSIRFSPYELELFRLAAGRHHMTLSEWVRTRLKIIAEAEERAERVKSHHTFFSGPLREIYDCGCTPESVARGEFCPKCCLEEVSAQ
jgi:hypothetical protein